MVRASFSWLPIEVWKLRINEDGVFIKLGWSLGGAFFPWDAFGSPVEMDLPWYIFLSRRTAHKSRIHGTGIALVVTQNVWNWYFVPHVPPCPSLPSAVDSDADGGFTAEDAEERGGLG